MVVAVVVIGEQQGMVVVVVVVEVSSLASRFWIASSDSFPLAVPVNGMLTNLLSSVG